MRRWSWLWYKSNKGLCGVTQGQKYWVAVRRGLLILLRKKGWGIGILRFLGERYAIQKIKSGMHGCAQLDACNWWDGGGWLRVHEGVIICGSNVGCLRRLQNDIGHAILKNCSWGSSFDMILIKTGITWLCKNGGGVKSYKEWDI